MLWLRYGLAIRDAPVVLVNGFGAAVACLTMIAYYIYSSDRVLITSPSTIRQMSPDGG